MTLRWFFSRTVRQATDLSHRVEKILHAQRDVLTPQAIAAVRKSTDELRAATQKADLATVETRATELENTANKWLKPYPNAGLRENVDVVLVALVIALGIRTFFLQPMAIPSGSMQPTLYGITHEDLRKEPNAEIPNIFTRTFNGLARGIWYYHKTARQDGVFQRIEPPITVFPFVKKQRLIFRDQQPYTVWFPPDEFEKHLQSTGLIPGALFHKGEDIIKLKVVSGDRLFVDRFTYNFRRPRRGEIIIFASHGLPELTQDTHYIKRLVGLGGERIRIGNDRHVVADGQRLDAATPHFENLYSFSGPPRPNQYSGHVNKLIGRQYTPPRQPDIAPLFPDGDTELWIPPRYYFVLGDNTMNSFDSRYWGAFPRDHVVGKLAFVFWPISSRFGWAVR